MSFANLPAPSGHRLCRHLRCKEMYYTSQEQLARARTDLSAAFESRVFWCLKTYQAEGPGGGRCGAEECPPTRACYEA